VRQCLIVRNWPAHVPDEIIGHAVTDSWALDVRSLRYFPEGGGAYDWIVEDGAGRTWFVTCDDLDTKPWLGADRDAIFDGLRRAYETAIGLRRAGLPFVVAPIPASSGAPANRIDDRHSVCVFQYVDGTSGEWGRPVASRTRHEVLRMLTELHRSAPPDCIAVGRGLTMPDRAAFETALAELDKPWHGGPLSDLARCELAAHDDVITPALRRLDGLAARLTSGGATAVVTHGEPHPGNLIDTVGGVALIDWDTVALDRPERDLWMLDDHGGATVAAAYRALTGVAVEREALTAYRLLWALNDLAAFSLQLRGEHQLDADSTKALEALRSILRRHEPSPYGVWQASPLVCP
jgi:spectinomycin phosphotransferase